MEKFKKILLLLLILALPYHFQVISILLSDVGVLKLWKEMVIGVLFLITLYQLITGKKKFKISTFEIMLVVFMAIIFIYVCFSHSMYHALYISRIYFVPLLLVPIIKYTDIDKKEIAFVLKLVMINGIILCVWGVFQAHILGDSFLIDMGYQTKRVHHGLRLKNEFYMLGGGYMQRVTSTFAAPNTYGMFLTIMISVVLFVYKKLGINKIFAYITIAVSLITLVLTFSRTSWVACVAVFVLCFITNTDKTQKMLVVKAGIACVVVAVLYIVIDKLLIHTSVVNAFTTLLYNTFTGKDSSFLGHWNSWLDSIENMFKHPLGLGLGKNGPRAKLFIDNPNLTESSYFLMEYEVGIIGAIVYFGGYVRVIMDNVKTYRETKRNEILVITAVVMVMLIGYLSLPFVQDFELLVMFYIVASLQYNRCIQKD